MRSWVWGWRGESGHTDGSRLGKAPYQKVVYCKAGRLHTHCEGHGERADRIRNSLTSEPSSPETKDGKERDYDRCVRLQSGGCRTGKKGGLKWRDGVEEEDKWRKTVMKQKCLKGVETETNSSGEKGKVTEMEWKRQEMNEGVVEGETHWRQIGVEDWVGC